ncbi:MAG TPA: DUF222 domain-containing protein [Kribbella sp.]
MEILGERPAWSMSDSEKLSALDAAVAERARLEVVELELIAELERNGYAQEIGARDTANVLSKRYRWDLATARRTVRFANALTKHPATAAALPNPTTPFPNPATARPNPDDTRTEPNDPDLPGDSDLRNKSDEPGAPDQLDDPNQHSGSSELGGSGELGDSSELGGSGEPAGSSELGGPGEVGGSEDLGGSDEPAGSSELGGPEELGGPGEVGGSEDLGGSDGAEEPGGWRVHPSQAEAILAVLAKIPTTVPIENVEFAEQRLIELAATHTPSQLRDAGKLIIAILDPDGPEPKEKQAYARESLNWRNVDQGVKFHGYLACENAELFRTIIHTGAKPRKTLDGQPDPRPATKRQADALTTALTNALGNISPTPKPSTPTPHTTATPNTRAQTSTPASAYKAGRQTGPLQDPLPQLTDEVSNKAEPTPPNQPAEPGEPALPAATTGPHEPDPPRTTTEPHEHAPLGATVAPGERAALGTTTEPHEHAPLRATTEPREPAALGATIAPGERATLRAAVDRGGTASPGGSGTVRAGDDAAGAAVVPGHGPKTHISVTIDFNDLKSATTHATGTLMFGDTLSAATIRRLACDAEVLPIVLGSKSQPLDVGTTQRLVTAPMRRALNVRDRGCVVCGAPPTQCEAHHVEHWIDGGPTAVSNLVLLCKRDHIDLHSGHCHVQIIDDVVHVTRPTWADPTRTPRDRYRPPQQPATPNTTASPTATPARPPTIAGATSVAGTTSGSTNVDPWDDHPAATTNNTNGTAARTPTTTPTDFNPWGDQLTPTTNGTARHTPTTTPADFNPWGDDSETATSWAGSAVAAGPINGPATREPATAAGRFDPWGDDSDDGGIAPPVAAERVAPWTEDSVGGGNAWDDVIADISGDAASPAEAEYDESRRTAHGQNLGPASQTGANTAA